MINDSNRAIRRAALLALLLMLALAAPALADADGTVTYRALLIGNSDYTNNAYIDDLKSCGYDLANMKSALQSGSIHYDKVVALSNQTSIGISAAVNDIASWGVDDDDVTVFYYSGHGASNGLIGVGYKSTYSDTYNFATLQGYLSLVPGTVVVLLDSCHSGGLINKGAVADSFSDNAIAAFSGAGTSGITAKAIVSGTKFHVIASSSETQYSYAKNYGLATNALCEAMGWQHSASSAAGNTLTNLEGDENGDLSVTIGEAYNYAAKVVSEELSNTDYQQDMQIYPVGSAQTLIARAAADSDDDEEIAKAQVSTMNFDRACIAPGKTIQLNSGLSGTVTWSSTAPSIATVDSHGLVTGVKSSSNTVAVIKAKSGAYETSCQMRVLTASKVVSAVRLKYGALTLQQGSAYTMPTKFSPSSAQYKKLRWKSDDEDIATISSSGRITAVAKTGSTVITATATSGVTATCTVTCIPAQPKSVKLDKTKLTLLPGVSTLDRYMLTEVISPSIAEDKTVKWTSSNDNVATVNEDGQVIAHSAGKAVITVKTNTGGKKATCTVTVVKNQSIPRSKPKGTAGKVVSSAHRIYLATDNTIRVEMYFYNRTRYTQDVPEPSKGLVVFKLKNGTILTAGGTFTVRPLRSGHYLVYSFKFDLDDYTSLKNRDLRGCDAWYDADN
jgi:uncharacterized protein YjdB